MVWKAVKIMAAQAKNEKSEMPSHTAAALSYILGIITGILFWATKKNDDYVRFHAIQSIGLSLLWFAGWVVLTILPVVGWILLPFWGLLMFVFWLVSIVKAYQGERFELPVIGKMIQQFGKQIGL